MEAEIRKDNPSEGDAAAVCAGPLNFFQAIEALKKGYKLQRFHWQGYMTLTNGRTHYHHTGKNHAFQSHMFSWTDIIAEDWYILD